MRKWTVKRYNRTNFNAIGNSMDKEENRDKTVSKIRVALNNTVNTATGKSVHVKFSWGTDPKRVGEAFLYNALTLTLEGRRETLTEVRENVSKKIKDNQQKQKERYDKHRSKPRQFSIGEQVLIRNTGLNNEGESRKTLPK